MVDFLPKVKLEVAVDIILYGLFVGRQSIKDEVAWGTPDWTEYNVSLSKSIMGLDFAVTYSDTDLSEADCFGGGNICDPQFVFSISGGF